MAKRIVVPEKPNIEDVLSSALLGDAIRYVRTSINLSIEDAANISNISKQSFNDLELGKPGCRLSTVLSVTKGLGIKLHITLPDLEGDNNGW